MDIDGVNVAEPPPCFLIVYNVSKKHNVGMLARSAAAFGVKEVGIQSLRCGLGSCPFCSYVSSVQTSIIPLEATARRISSLLSTLAHSLTAALT